MAAAVDEERGCAGHAAVVRALDVALDAQRVLARLERLLEARHVETDLVRVVDEVDDAERRLAVEQPVVHRPERALLAGGLGGFRGDLGVLVDVDEWEMAEDVAELAARRREELTDHRLGPTAVRALEVSVLDERDRRVLWPTDVVAIGIDGSREIDDRRRRWTLHPRGEPVGETFDDTEHEPAQHGRQRPTRRGSRAARPGAARPRRRCAR